MKKEILIFLAGLALAAACTKSETEVPELRSREGVLVTLPTVTFDDATRGASMDDGFALTWDDGDRISIWSSEGTPLLYRLVNVLGDSAEAAFDGGGFTLTDGDDYYSLFPPVWNPDAEVDAVPMTLSGQVQTANADAAHLKAFAYSYASATCTGGSTRFDYAYLPAFLQVNVTIPSEMEPVRLEVVSDGDGFLDNAVLNLLDGGVDTGDNSPALVLGFEGFSLAAADVLTANLAAAPILAQNVHVVLTDAQGGTYVSPSFALPAVESGHARRISASVAAVATVDGVAYPTLAAAVAAAGTTPSTVKLIANADLGTEGLVISEGQDITIALGNYSITGAVDGRLVTNNGTLTFTGINGCVANTDVSAQGHDAVYNAPGATLVIKGGHFGDTDTDRTNANGANRGAAVRNFGTATISGGYYTACDNFTNGGYAYAIINDGDGDLTVTSGTVYGRNNGNVAANDGTVLLKGGSYTLSGAESYYSVYNYDGEVTIQGGTFRKEGNTRPVLLRDNDAEATGTFTLKGGMYYGNGVKPAWVESGYDLVELDDDPETWQVVPEVTVNQASDFSVSTAGVYTFEIDIPNSNGFAGGTFSTGYVEMNLNGHMLATKATATRPAFNIRNAQKAVFNGPGAVVGNGPDQAAVWANGEEVEVTINGGDFSANADGSECIYCYLGTIAITGGSFRLAGDDADTKYLLNCYDSNRAAGKAWITVTGGSFRDFNPADNSAEGAHTNFVASGYHVVADTSTEPGHTWYTVVAD